MIAFRDTKRADTGLLKAGGSKIHIEQNETGGEDYVASPCRADLGADFGRRRTITSTSSDGNISNENYAQKKSHVVKLAKRLHYSQPRNNSPKRKTSKRKQEIRYNTETQVNEIMSADDNFTNAFK